MYQSYSFCSAEAHDTGSPHDAAKIHKKNEKTRFFVKFPLAPVFAALFNISKSIEYQWFTKKLQKGAKKNRKK
jgi:hypothetical protein